MIMKKIFLIIGMILCCGTGFAQNKGFEKAIEANGGIGLDEHTNYSFGVNFIGGYRINEAFFIGAGLGYSYIDGLYYKSYEYLGSIKESYHYNSYDARNNVQAFARAKYNLTKSNISPFLLIDLGGTFGLTSNEIKMANGFMYEPAFGVDFKTKNEQTIYVMLGYKGTQYQYKYFNTTYGDSGVELQKGNAGTFCIHLGFKF